MKTRDDLYGQEASDLLKIISMYRTLEYKQILQLYPDREPVIKNLLNYLEKQGRIYINRENERCCASESCDSDADLGMIAAFWVLLDFIDKVENHLPSDFPVKISFLADGELYEIIYAGYEQENLINHAFSINDEDTTRRIAIVEKAEQIPKLQIPNTTGYCVVSKDGKVHYYKLE